MSYRYRDLRRHNKKKPQTETTHTRRRCDDEPIRPVAWNATGAALCRDSVSSLPTKRSENPPKRHNANFNTNRGDCNYLFRNFPENAARNLEFRPKMAFWSRICSGIRASLFGQLFFSLGDQRDLFFCPPGPPGDDDSKKCQDVADRGARD